MLVQSVPEENQVSGRDEQTKIFEELINKGQYKEIAELGWEMNKKELGWERNKEELSKCLCQVVTNLDHFKGLFNYLKQRDIVPDFLAHGEMVLVRKVIVETDLLETEYNGNCNYIYDAMALSFNEDRHERVAGLFEAAHERPKWKEEFDRFVEGFFRRYPPEENGMLLKRFFTLHSEAFGKKHPATFDSICQRLVEGLKWQSNGILASQKLLIDLVGQPSLLTPVACAWGFLHLADDRDRTNLIKYGYKEAIEEGLKKKYEDGGKRLWAFMVRKLPNQFSGEYPSTDEARSIALKNFKPTKQDREEAWAKENVPILLAQLEQIMPGLFPKVLWNLIFEYGLFTWIHV